MHKDIIDSIKTFFEEEIKLFWDKQEHIAVHQDGKAIGKLFGQYPYLWIVRDQDISLLLEKKRLGFASIQ